MNDIFDDYIGQKYAEEERNLSSSIDSVARLIFLRLILKAYEVDPLIKKIKFLFRFDYIPLSFDKKINALKELVDDKIVNIKNFKVVLEEIAKIKEHYEIAHHFLFTQRRPVFEMKEHILNIDILKTKPEIENKYNEEIENFILDIHEYSLSKQGKIVLESILERQKFLGKNIMTFSYDDIDNDSRKYINLFFIMMYLEKQNELKIIKISTPLIFHIELSSFVFRGKNYLINMKDCYIQYDDGEKVIFKPDSQIYKILDLFVNQKKERISDVDFAFAGTDNPKSGDNQKFAKNTAKRIRGDIRKRNLHSKEGGEHDIFSVDMGYTSLRV
jgi:hypothetical protein